MVSVIQVKSCGCRMDATRFSINSRSSRALVRGDMARNCLSSVGLTRVGRTAHSIPAIPSTSVPPRSMIETVIAISFPRGAAATSTTASRGTSPIRRTQSHYFIPQADVHLLRPVIDGKRLLLLYATDAGVFVRGGTIEAGRAKVGEAVPLPGLSYNNIGRQFLYHGGRLDLPIGPAGGSGPRLLHGDFDKVFAAVAPHDGD